MKTVNVTLTHREGTIEEIKNVDFGDIGYLHFKLRHARKGYFDEYNDHGGISKFDFRAPSISVDGTISKTDIQSNDDCLIKFDIDQPCVIALSENQVDDMLKEIENLYNDKVQSITYGQDNTITISGTQEKKGSLVDLYSIQIQDIDGIDSVTLNTLQMASFIAGLKQLKTTTDPINTVFKQQIIDGSQNDAAIYAHRDLSSTRRDLNIISIQRIASIDIVLDSEQLKNLIIACDNLYASRNERSYRVVSDRKNEKMVLQIKHLSSVSPKDM